MQVLWLGLRSRLAHENGKPVATRRRKASARRRPGRTVSEWVEHQNAAAFWSLSAGIDVASTVFKSQATTTQPKRGFGKILAVSGGIVTLGVLAAVYLGYRHYQTELDKLLIDSARDYSRVPFSMIDATEYCQRRTQRRYGSSLALSYVDEHSTRVDPKSGLYKIFLFARVGDLQDYDEEAIHCFVDPERRVLTHYRTINLRKASLMSRAARFFGI